MPDYIADDYAFIAKRLRTLEQKDPVKWGVWFRVETEAWLTIDGGVARRAVGGRKPSLYSTEEAARNAVATLASTMRKDCVVKPYDQGSDDDVL